LEGLERLGINLTFLVAQAVNFGVLLFIMARFIYPPLQRTLEARQARVRDSLAEAERVKQEAAAKQRELQAQLEKERREAQEALQRALQASEKVKDEIIAQAKQEAEQIKARARQDAEAERRRALAEAQRAIADLSILATRKVIGEALPAEQHRRLVQEFLATLEKT